MGSTVAALATFEITVRCRRAPFSRLENIRLKLEFGGGETTVTELEELREAHPTHVTVLTYLTRQLEVLQVRERINSQVQEEMGRNQREYVLRQQLKAIKEELGELDESGGDLEEFKDMKGVAGVHLMPIEWEHKVPEIAERAGVLPRPQV